MVGRKFITDAFGFEGKEVRFLGLWFQGMLEGVSWGKN